MRADDDLAAVALALHLDAEPLSVFDLGRDRRVQRDGGPVVHAVALVPAHRPKTVRRDLGAVLEGKERETIVKLDADRQTKTNQSSDETAGTVGTGGYLLLHRRLRQGFHLRGLSRPQNS